MKRFTETEKWRDPWFQKLDREARTLWLWLCDRVDNAGVVDICWPICNAETGGMFSDETMAAFGERVEKLANGKWWLPKFVNFQFGDLSSVSKVHQSVEKLLSRHSLSDRVGHRVSHTLKDKDKDKEKERGTGGGVTSLEVPSVLKTKAFLIVWEEWIVFRKKMKACKDWKTLFSKQLEQLESWGEAGAIEALNQSMRGGWQGLFEPKVQMNKNAGPGGISVNSVFQADSVIKDALEAIRTIKNDPSSKERRNNEYGIPTDYPTQAAKDSISKLEQKIKETKDLKLKLQ